jgi:hypothetical protein
MEVKIPGHRGQSGNIGWFATYIFGRIAGEMSTVDVAVEVSADVNGSTVLWKFLIRRQMISSK